MAAVISPPTEPKSRSSRRVQDKPVERTLPAASRVLAVVDGSERTGRLVEHVKSLAAAGKPVEVVLLNVQPAPVDGRLRGYGSFKRQEIEARLVGCIGRRAVAAAERALAHAGIECHRRVEIGDPVETILRVAAEEDCGLILISNPPSGALQKWLRRTTGLMLAAMATQVAQLANVPVIVLK
jgi:nucleotide-binding universal stress UspA family protein